MCVRHLENARTIVDRKQGNRIARALKDSFNGICSFNDTLTPSGNGGVFAERAAIRKFMMTNNDTGLRLGSPSSPTNSSPLPHPLLTVRPPGRRPNLIPRILFTRYTSSSEFPSSSSVTRTRRFLKRKLHGYAKLGSSPWSPAAGDAGSGKTVCNAESPALSLPANRFSRRRRGFRITWPDATVSRSASRRGNHPALSQADVTRRWESSGRPSWTLPLDERVRVRRRPQLREDIGSRSSHVAWQMRFSKHRLTSGMMRRAMKVSMVLPDAAAV